MFLGNNLIFWSSKHQNVVSRSSTEAKYQVVTNGVAEACWLRQVLQELHTPLMKSTLIYYDNINDIYLFTNPIQHQRTKHIEIDLHFVREHIVIGDVRILHMPTNSQFTDIFVKGLPTSVFLEFRFSLNIHSG
jgi:glucan phosphorylase